MIIIINNYKSITLLTKHCRVTFVKRFTGSKKFTDIGASILNKCNKGLGCAMQANTKNIAPINKQNNNTTSSVTEPQKNFNNNNTTSTIPEVQKDFKTSTTWKPNFIGDTLNQKLLLPVIVPEPVDVLPAVVTVVVPVAVPVTVPVTVPVVPVPPIPVAPSLPSKCLSSPKKAENGVSFKTELQNNKIVQKNQQQTSTLTNANNQTYVTTITKKTTVDDLTKEQILQGMIDRGLLKKANDFKNQGDFQVVPIELQKGESFPLNKTKHNVKLSLMGQAYAENLKNKTESESTPIKDNFAKNPQDLKYLLIVPPKAASDCLVETGNQKHLVVVFDNSTGEYYAVGYLTSKKTGTPLSIPQYKTFTQNKQTLPEKNNNNKTVEKTQYIKPYEKPTKIDPKDINIVKYNEEYFETLSDTDKLIFEDVIQNQKIAGSIVSFNKNGLTTENCLQMCKEFDDIEATKKKDSKETKKQHPITKDQQKKNQENKKNMEEKKNKQQDSNNNIYNHEKYL